MTAREVRSIALLIAGISLAAVLGVPLGIELGLLIVHHVLAGIVACAAVLFGAPLTVALIAHLVIRRRGA